jgi:hypothetical protein
MLRLYCDHVATVLRATSNIRSPPFVLFDTKLNITSLQHRNSTSAALKFKFATPNNTCLPIETQHSQHRKSMFPTLKIFRSNFETFTWNTRNMPRTRMQHIHNDCMNNKSWPLEIYFCNITTLGSTFTTLTWNTCSIFSKPLKHLYDQLATCKHAATWLERERLQFWIEEKQCRRGTRRAVGSSS